MKTFTKIFFFFSINIIFFISCSSSEETQVKSQTDEKDTIYVFDEIPPEDTFKFESPVPQSTDVYVIQIGAFSTFDRAKEFADQSWAQLNKEIKVEFKQDKNLYVVWIYPPYIDKSSAESYRSNIQLGGDFKDAWIVIVESKK